MGLFADDTIFWTAPEIRCPNRYSRLQETMNDFADWCNKWKLSLNASKCNVLKIGRVHEIKNNTIIENTNNNTIDSSSETSESNQIIDSSSETSEPSDIEELYNKLFGTDNNKPESSNQKHKPKRYFPYKRNYSINNINIKYKNVIKYLGLWIDSDLNFQHHINKTIAKIQSSYYHLIKIIKNGIKFKPKSIITIYKTKARAIIEYAAEFYYQNVQNKELQIWQNKFIRLAAPAKLSTNIDILEKLNSCENLQERIDKLLGRSWLRCLYSDKYHPLKELHDEFLLYINKYDNKDNMNMNIKINENESSNYTNYNAYFQNNMNILNKNINHNSPPIIQHKNHNFKNRHRLRHNHNHNNNKNNNYKNKLKHKNMKYGKIINKLYYTKKSFIYKGYQLINKYKNKNKLNIPINPQRSLITALPNYLIKPHYNNFTIINNESNPDNFKQHTCYYSDGSCFPNPGIGAYGWYGPYPTILKSYFHINPIPKMTTASYCELKAVELWLIDIHKDKIKNLINNKLAIFIDNIGVLNYMNFTAYPKYNDYKLIVENIFNLLNKLHHKLPNTHFHFIKIPAHAGYKGNENIDKKVRKLAYETAQKIQCQNPIISNYPTALAQLYKQINLEYDAKWETRDNKDNIIYKNNNKWNKRLNYLYKLLDRNDASIMIKVLSEHIGLNEYYHKKNYIIKDVIRDMEKRNHFNAMLYNKSKFETDLFDLNMEKQNLNNQLYNLNKQIEHRHQLNTNNNNNIGQNNNNNIPPLISRWNIIDLHQINNNFMNNHIDMEVINENEFKSNYDEWEYGIPIEQRYYSNNMDILENIQPNICENCSMNKIENINHFICICPKFDNERKILKQKLVKINMNYNHQWFNINDILFPYKKKKLKKSISKQISIWKYLIQYIINTGRIRINYSNKIELFTEKWNRLIEYEKNKENIIKELIQKRKERKMILKSNNRKRLRNCNYNSNKRRRID